MGLFNIFDPILDFLLTPLINLGYLPALVILSLVFTVALIFFHKKVTDQELMKRLKEETDELRNEMKTLKDNPERMIEVRGRMMETNMKAFKQNLKPSLYTALPFIIIIGWMSAHFAYLPLMPGDEFTATVTANEGVSELRIVQLEGIELLTNVTQKVVDRTATWGLKAGKEGIYTLRFAVGEEVVASKNVVITTEKKDGSPLKRGKGFIDYIYSSSGEYLAREELESVSMISVSNKPVKPFGELSIFGWEPGWLGTYIILSIIFNLVLRKLLKVY